MITDYIIVEKEDKEDLVMEIVDCIEQGWQPIGGISVITVRFNKTGDMDKNGEESLSYSQAMVKYDSK